jgi:hypothetical protein
MPEEGAHSGPEASGATSESENDYDDHEQLVKEEDDKMADRRATSEGAEASGEPRKKYDPKDPLRPRRKKARRACFACQRAHLTCGKPSFYSWCFTSPPYCGRGAVGFHGFFITESICLPFTPLIDLLLQAKLCGYL